MGILQTAKFAAIGGVALYYGQVGYQVYDSHGEERRIQDKYQSELKAAAVAEKSAEREKQLAITLEDQAKEHQAALVGLDKDLSAAYKQVEILEDQKNTMMKAVEEALVGSEQARGNIAKLTAEVAKRRQDALVAEQALAAARVHSKDIDALLNPLNHPMVVFNNTS
ncbi:hypothetical protein NADE_006728 [Nannochloris sp. 'desiccata']|nr:hypothetical protein KSW81_005330 [Chlorella desiccata (nom. nud.)]KAH7621465.1 hypothetical protein NADE_006728 [Chlorella desiccata (nom. nud.)]